MAGDCGPRIGWLSRLVNSLGSELPGISRFWVLEEAKIVSAKLVAGWMEADGKVPSWSGTIIFSCLVDLNVTGELVNCSIRNDSVQGKAI